MNSPKGYAKPIFPSFDAPRCASIGQMSVAQAARSTSRGGTRPRALEGLAPWRCANTRTTDDQRTPRPPIGGFNQTYPLPGTRECAGHRPRIECGRKQADGALREGPRDVRVRRDVRRVALDALAPGLEWPRDIERPAGGDEPDLRLVPSASPSVRIGPDGTVASPAALWRALGVSRDVYRGGIRRDRDGADATRRPRGGSASERVRGRQGARDTAEVGEDRESNGQRSPEHRAT